MLDIKFLRSNPDVVKQNIKNKFQDEKLPLVDEVIELDKRNREIKQEVEALRAEKNKASKEIGAMMAQKKLEEAEALKKKVAESNGRINELSEEEKEVEEKIKKNMMIIPNIIDPSVPIGKDDSENVEVERFGEPVVPDFEIPYHTEIMESFNGIDLDAARRVAGNGFYYLMGDIARLHSAVIAYARDFMALVVEYSVLAADSCLFVDDASDIMPVASAVSSKSPDAVFLMEASAFFATSYNFP